MRSTGQQYVETGGTIIIGSGGGAPEYINDLTSMFGFTYELYLIQKENIEDRIRAPFKQTALTPRVLQIGAVGISGGYPLDEVEDGIIFSRIDSDADVFIERDNEKVSAADLPFGVLTTHGDGLVIGYGKQDRLTKLPSRDIIRQFVRFGGKHARYAQRKRNTMLEYANENDIVDTDGLRDAIEDWRADVIETALLHELLDYWGSGEPLE